MTALLAMLRHRTARPPVLSFLRYGNGSVVIGHDGLVPAYELGNEGIRPQPQGPAPDEPWQGGWAT